MIKEEFRNQIKKAMNMEDNYYEEIVIKLHSAIPKSRKELHAFLKKRGYKSEDDFYYLPRNDKKIKNWQAQDVLTLKISYKENLIYETEEDVEEGKSTYWDKIVISYLMASLPSEYIYTLSNEVNSLQEQFKLNLFFKDTQFTNLSLLEKLCMIAKELADNDLPPGSEELAILIALQYPRR